MYRRMNRDALVNKIVRNVTWDKTRTDLDTLLNREWLVANGLGGYASTTVAGVCTRKYHGLLVAAMPAPYGRVVMLTNVAEEVRLPDKTNVEIGGIERTEGGLHLPGAQYLSEFRLEAGLAVWRYEIDGYCIEKRIMLPHFQNTVFINYRLISGGDSVRLRLRPALHFRPQEREVTTDFDDPYTIKAIGNQYEVKADADLPILRFFLYGEEGSFNLSGGEFKDIFYRVEHRRRYRYQSRFWDPGFFRVMLYENKDATLVASTEPWDVIHALKPREAFAMEVDRRQRLIAAAHPEAQTGFPAELVLTAEQFIIAPTTRVADEIRAHAAGDEVRTVIAGYHWFTDWGRDTMISLEGLTLVTGRFAEAGYILRTFAYYVRDGLIPNMFPEGKAEGLYHTADATLWFFHAIDRYMKYTGDFTTLRQLLPILVSIVGHHVRGTRFGIGVDPEDGLLNQGAPGYQLTWMDAKAGDWVVTPRRGKAVEINALWYNALRLLEGWVRSERSHEEAQWIAELAQKAFVSFNRRFWYEEGGYLYDVIDGERGHDLALRPNQLFAISLGNPVLDPSRWESVVKVVRDHLLTPFGLRTLAPEHPDYQRRYYGDVYSRDAAYHQGTVWPWLLGPFVDAWLRVYPEDYAGARRILENLGSHLNDSCIGSISEVFDAELPFNPEGCISQAWSVAEVLRCWIKTSGVEGIVSEAEVREEMFAGGLHK